MAPDEEYQLDAGPVRRPAPDPLRYSPRAETFLSARASPPDRPLLSGVYAFPWQAGVRARWGLLVLGCTLLDALLVFTIVASGVGPGAFDQGASPEGLALTTAGFFGIVDFWIAAWTLSFGAACMQTIVSETADGAEEIEQWPSSDWREWVWNMAFAGIVGFTTLAVGYVAALAARWASDGAVGLAVMPGVVFLVFPFCYLSALETGTPWLPFSPPIVASMPRLAAAWLAFYLLNGLLAAAVGGVLFACARWLGSAGALIAGPCFATAWLIYARQLGRLAWIITDDINRRTSEELSNDLRDS